MVCGRARAGSHGLGNDLQFMWAWFAMLLLVPHFGIVLQEELTGLLQHSSALTDGVALAVSLTEPGPFCARLFASNPEDRRDTNN